MPNTSKLSDLFVEQNLSFLDDIEKQHKSALLDIYRFEALLKHQSAYLDYLIARSVFFELMAIEIRNNLPFKIK